MNLTLKSAVSFVATASCFIALAVVSPTISQQDIPVGYVLGYLNPVQTLQRLTATQQQIADYIQARYNVEPDTAEAVVTHAYAQAAAHELEPTLVLAVIAVESNFNPTADNGLAKGLMQIVPHFHKKRIESVGGTEKLYSVAENIEVGAGVLRDFMKLSHNNLRHALMYYNGSYGVDTYPNKVLREKARIEQLIKT